MTNEKKLDRQQQAQRRHRPNGKERMIEEFLRDRRRDRLRSATSAAIQAVTPTATLARRDSINSSLVQSGDDNRSGKTIFKPGRLNRKRAGGETASKTELVVHVAGKHDYGLGTADLSSVEIDLPGEDNRLPPGLRRKRRSLSISPQSVPVDALVKANQYNLCKNKNGRQLDERFDSEHEPDALARREKDLQIEVETPIGIARIVEAVRPTPVDSDDTAGEKKNGRPKMLPGNRGSSPEKSELLSSLRRRLHRGAGKLRQGRTERISSLYMSGLDCGGSINLALGGSAPRRDIYDDGSVTKVKVF